VRGPRDGQFGKAGGLSRYLTQESLAIAFWDCCIMVALIFVAAAVVSLCMLGGKAKES
jgi:hypothetical protein